jgi:DNA polymerase III epsilon subunit-like protein
MISNSSEKIYCSVDLEFTGFDPSRDQILEIGFAFFKVTKEGLEIIEEWSQVFRPSIEVHPKILGLTGITQKELDEAPEFNDHREFLQSKLGDAIIVGHNPVMDVKFLESYGIKLSGKVIDTLELVQFILPTHHSYNLENLVHYFGIKHAQAHRALGDAISTVKVLENLIHLYQQFSEKIKEELDSVIERGEFLWKLLVSTNFAKKTIQENDSLKQNDFKNVSPLELSDGLITIDDIPNNHEARIAKGLKEKELPVVLAVEDSNAVMRLWKEGLVHGVFKSEDTFSRSAFNNFLANATEQEELRFCLKIIVWLHTNWQTEVIFDLNISFFGGQFRSSITGGKPKVGKENVLCVDYATLQVITDHAAQASLLSNRELVIADMQNFEKFISSGFGTKLGWGSVLYSLRMIYNPETEFGDLDLKEEVTNALIATDLFFGLVYMLLHQTFPSSQYATVHEMINNHPQIYSRLKLTSESLVKKLEIIEELDSQVDLGRTLKFLKSYFEEAEDRVKWVTIDERNLSLHDQPIDISESVNKILAPFSKHRFTETIGNKDLLSYLVDRLGLDTEISELPNESLPSNFNFVLEDEILQDKDIHSVVVQSPLPLVVILPSIVDVKNFYNSHYSEIKQNAALFAQGYSGGGNKMFRNFSIKENSILLVTADFMSKQNYLIPAQTIIFTDIPPVEIDHPYTAALLSHWKTKHKDLELIFSFSKIASVLKKIKMHGNILVKMYGDAKKLYFVDKLH